VDLFLKKLVIGMEKDEKIRSSIKGALTYPIILLIVAMAVIILMMVYVVPVFQDMFANVKGGLPATTQAVVDISNFIRDPLRGGLFAGLVTGAGFLISISVKKNYKLRRLWHKFILNLPLFGDLIQKSALAKIAMIQGNLTAAGVPVIEALDISASSIDNIVIKEAMVDVKRGVFSGEPLSKLFENKKSIFPITFTAMVSVGEKTGNMEEMFESIASYYEEEMDSTIDKLTEMLEPIMIVFMGITVGFILVAMYTPMFQMGEAL
jgi:type IV pilus assembly protein PilC